MLNAEWHLVTSNWTARHPPSYQVLVFLTSLRQALVGGNADFSGSHGVSCSVVCSVTGIGPLPIGAFRSGPHSDLFQRLPTTTSKVDHPGKIVCYGD